MSSWFARHSSLDTADPSAPVDTYAQGRRDERQQTVTAAPDSRVAKAELDSAYDRGRREARSRRRGSPLGMLLLLIVVVAVAAAIVFMKYGSFTSAGQAADTALSSTAQHVTAPVHQAADNAGNALQNAGQNLKQTAGSSSQ